MLNLISKSPKLAWGETGQKMTVTKNLHRPEGSCIWNEFPFR